MGRLIKKANKSLLDVQLKAGPNYTDWQTNVNGEYVDITAVDSRDGNRYSIDRIPLAEYNW